MIEIYGGSWQKQSYQLFRCDINVIKNGRIIFGFYKKSINFRRF